MDKDDKAREELKALVSLNRKLAGDLKKKGTEIEQLFAARKDALRGAFQACQQSAAAKPTETRNSPAGAAPPRGSTKGEPQPHPALIVVEDDADDFMLLKRALWKSGATAQVWWAHNAEEALRLLEQLAGAVSHVCLVLDIQLPGGSGFEVLQKVRASTHGARIKVAFLTGFSDETTEHRALESGADAFFKKSVEPADLLRVAREIQRLAVR